MKKALRAVGSYFRITDRWLLFFWVTASGLSMLFLAGIYNSNMVSSSTLVTQGAGILLGLTAAIVISKLDYHLLLKLWKLYLPLCLFLILLTALVGTVRGDNQAWLMIPIGGGREVSLQPSELLKISFITTFSMHLAKVKDQLNKPLNLLLLCAHGGIHILLIHLQGDDGSALIFVFIFVIMLFVAGIGYRYILGAVVALAVIAPVFWFKIMKPDQKMRVLSVLYPEQASADYLYQQLRGRMSLGSGGVQGTGIFAGKHLPVPEIYNDFIFSFIGESAGFIGCLGVIALLTAICLKILYNSSIASDDTGRFICVGVAAMILGQMIINLGMCLSLLPVIGVTLPLFSAGGTSVVTLYLGLGLVLSVYCGRRTGLFSE
ncbi:FtsW/RodA/SpoVE family cell cycle protein [Oscillospiraceae bacterium MB08-C2-2]|nr:FtsW/RodA/SpoVE family cell cycle protein [Oscillospiraceae bacterium MB08-C2-2]